MKVLLTTDGSEFSKVAIEKCCRMFEKLADIEIEILSVYELMLPPTEPFAASAEYVQEIDNLSHKKANEIATQAETYIRANYSELADKLTKKVVNGSPARTIVDEAENWEADLIVVGSHGYGFWKRALLGSVSNSVIQHAPCSVLVVRSPQEQNGKSD